MPRPSFTLFGDFRHELYRGPDAAAMLAAGQVAVQRGGVSALVVFDDATGAMTDLDLGESPAELEARLGLTPAPTEPPGGPGRPKLGVVSREVSLLPRHWEWLNGQSGGASAALRRLVEEARKQSQDADRQRVARDGLYRVMSRLAGDRPGFEEAARALYAGQLQAVGAWAVAQPDGIGTYLVRLVHLLELLVAPVAGPAMT